MATITPPAAARNLGEYQRRVRSPLARLRGYIRVYVGLEGALLLVLLLAGCFWVSLTLDYGLFKAARFDWVQAWPWGVRLVLFLLAAAAVLTVVTMTVLGRLHREFSDPALALVLERRFPHLLGDRLITAVELADLKKAQEQGYSPAMVLETIHEAAERVQQVPVAQVFDWRRLILRGILAAGLTLGLYLLAGGLFLTLDLLRHVHGGRIGYSRFNEVVQMWAERDVLVRHTVWMRQAQLEMVNVPETGLHVGKGDAAPQVHVRALEYVIAEPDSWDGWRALKWNEVGQYIGGDVLKEQHLPFTLRPRDPSGELTVDEAALALRKFDVQATASGSGARGWRVADSSVYGGWRPLLWTDLKPSTLNGDVPPSLPNWDGKPAAEALTVDDVEEAFAHARQHNDAAAFTNFDKVLEDLDAIAAVHDVLDRINARVEQPEMSRTMRRLDVPVSVHLSSSGGKDPPQANVNRGGDDEYAYDFKDLKETISFTMSADDYTTPSRSIELVDSPLLKSLTVQENQPAYLFYPPRPVGGNEEATTLAFLHGQKQPFQVQSVLESGSGASRIDAPAGTDLVLNAAASKDLTEAFLVLPAKKQDDFAELRVRIDPAKVRVEWWTPSFFGVKAPLLYKRADDDPRAAVVRSKKPGDAVRLPLEVGSDRRSFQVELPDVRRSLSFGFEYTDTDGVRGTSVVNVAVQADAAPVVQDLSIKDIRSITQISPDGEKKTVYLVTSRAHIPVAVRIGDDHCLGGVFYRFSVKPTPPAPPGPPEAPKPPNRAAEAPLPETEMTPEDFSATSMGLLGAPLGQGPLLTALAIAPARVKVVCSYSPPGFQDLAVGDGLPLKEVQELLKQPQQQPFRQTLMKRDADVHTDTINVGWYDPPLPNKPSWRDARDPNNPLHWDFPLWAYNLAVDDEHPNILWYQMEFRVEATDTDADDPTTAGGTPQPHRSKSKETYTFLVVRDSYLKGLIGQDEATQYRALNTQFQTIAGLTTDFDTFKKEAEAFEQRLKASGRPENVELAPEVEMFLQEVDASTAVSDKNGSPSHHRVDDPDKFLLNSPPADALKKRVQGVTQEIERLEKALKDIQDIKYYLTAASHGDPAELDRMLKDKQGVKLLLKMLDDNLPSEPNLRNAMIERKDDLRSLQDDLPVQNEEDVRRLMREDENLKDSVDTLVALVQGFRDQKSALTQTVETINNIQEILKSNDKLKAGDILTAQDVRSESINQSLDRALEATRKAVAAYEGLVREQQLNVLGLVQEPKLNVPYQNDVVYTQKRVIEKLHEIEKLDFPSATEAVAKFRKVLTDKALTEDERLVRSQEAGKNLQAPMTRLVADLYDVLEAIRREKTRQSLRDELVGIDIGVQSEAEYAKQVKDYLEGQIFDKP